MTFAFGRPQHCQASAVDAIRYGRRVVVPLVKASAVGKIANSRFNPTFKIGNTSVVLHPLEIVSVALDKLGKPVASLAENGDRIILALDDLLSRAWG